VLRVVLDTNVLVSSMLKPASATGVLLARWTQDGAFEVLLSVSNLEELRRVVRYPAIRKRIKMSDDELGLRVDMIDTLSTPVEAGRAGAGRVRDPDDEAILHTAVEGRADFIVTGDDLLTLLQFEGIPIVKPRAFLELLDRRFGQAGSVHDRSSDAVYRARGRPRRRRAR
jgi:putative PIN family toxin of toxin-antitoxin system